MIGSHLYKSHWEVPAEAPASEWAYELAERIVLGNQGVGNAASIIEQAFTEREAAAEAAGFRRGVEAAAKYVQENYPHDKRALVPGIRALLETQEKV